MDQRNFLRWLETGEYQVRVHDTRLAKPTEIDHDPVRGGDCAPPTIETTPDVGGSLGCRRGAEALDSRTTTDRIPGGS